MSHVLHCLRPAQFCVELSSRREADDANMERGDLHCIEGAFSKKAQIKLVIIGTFLMVVNSYNGSFLIVYLWRASFSCVSQLPCYLWIIWQEHPPLSKT